MTQLETSILSKCFFSASPLLKGTYEWNIMNEYIILSMG